MKKKRNRQIWGMKTIIRYKFCFLYCVLFHTPLSLSPVKYDVRTKLYVGRNMDNDAAFK